MGFGLYSTARLVKNAGTTLEIVDNRTNVEAEYNEAFLESEDDFDKLW